MTNEDQAVEATGIVRRLRDGRFRDDELDVVLNRLTTLLGDHDINLLHVPEDAGDGEDRRVMLVGVEPLAGGVGCPATPAGTR